jgi:hypothetical protein
MNLGGTVEGEGEVGRVRRVQFTANQGQEWTGIRTTTQERDFQVSKKGLTGVQTDKGKKWGLVIKRELLRGCKHMPQCIYCANKRLCLGYK